MSLYLERASERTKEAERKKIDENNFLASKQLRYSERACKPSVVVFWAVTAEIIGKYKKNNNNNNISQLKLNSNFTWDPLAGHDRDDDDNNNNNNGASGDDDDDEDEERVAIINSAV